MSTTTLLEQLFQDRFSGAVLDPERRERLRAYAAERIGRFDAVSEGYLEDDRQRDLSVTFHWGHDHPLDGETVIPGRMGRRHVAILARFMDAFGLERDLSGLRVLDIGAWTGGMSLILAALGARVVALEEVRKYADTVNFLSELYGLRGRLACVPESLYDFLPKHADAFDLIIYSGVIYHVTDPGLSLRLAFSALKDGGRCFVETAGHAAEESVCLYEGHAVHHSGTAEERNRGGWNYYIPSPSCLARWAADAGFQEVNVGPVVDDRIHARLTRTAFTDFLRAGVSNTRVR